MSHAANLRAHQQASSAKRRKLSAGDSQSRPVLNGVNGLLTAKNAHSITAKPSKNAKLSASSKSRDSNPRIGHAAEDDDVTRLANGSAAANENDDSDSGDDEDSDADSDDDLDQQEDESTVAGKAVPLVNGLSATSNAHLKSGDPDAGKVEGHDDQESGEPTFGDILRANAADQIDVTAEDANTEEARQLRPTGTLAPPPASSLGTVLTQALRSNDTPLLESCLRVSNLQDIRATVERIPSSQAAILLRKLAERMHQRPGRAGSLMVWIQWTVVAHGGYLASQPATMKEVRELYRVVQLRATGLQPLLALKGKLDMLEAQVALRRRRTAAAAPANREEDVIYVEGNESSDEEADLINESLENVGQEESDRDEGDAMPLTNGASVPASDDDDAEDGLDDELESDDADDNLIDDEAVSTDDDSDHGGLDDDVIFDEDDESEDEAATRPSKRSKAK